MASRKTNKKKIMDGRCTGIGPTYVPFYLSNENASCATSPMIPDRIEGRMVHCLSDTEAMLYSLLRWNIEIEHIREQYLLDTERINQVRKELGYSRVPLTTCFTTDFLVDFINGNQKAYSVKFRRSDFNPNSKKYKGRPNAYIRMVERQNTERAYWESLGVEFHIVTRDDLMQHRILIKNIDFVMGFWDESSIVNTDQMLLYLIAHHIIEVPMDIDFINPRALASSAKFDIEAVYRQCISLRKELEK